MSRLTLLLVLLAMGCSSSSTPTKGTVPRHKPSSSADGVPAPASAGSEQADKRKVSASGYSAEQGEPDCDELDDGRYEGCLAREGCEQKRADRSYEEQCYRSGEPPTAECETRLGLLADEYFQGQCEEE
jgi:hypothetical protein